MKKCCFNCIYFNECLSSEPYASGKIQIDNKNINKPDNFNWTDDFYCSLFKDKLNENRKYPFKEFGILFEEYCRIKNNAPTKETYYLLDFIREYLLENSYYIIEDKEKYMLIYKTYTTPNIFESLSKFNKSVEDNIILTINKL